MEEHLLLEIQIELDDYADIIDEFIKLCKDRSWPIDGESFKTFIEENV